MASQPFREDSGKYCLSPIGTIGRRIAARWPLSPLSRTLTHQDAAAAGPRDSSAPLLAEESNPEYLEDLHRAAPRMAQSMRSVSQRGSVPSQA